MVSLCSVFFKIDRLHSFEIRYSLFDILRFALSQDLCPSLFSTSRIPKSDFLKPCTLHHLPFFQMPCAVSRLPSTLNLYRYPETSIEYPVSIIKHPATSSPYPDTWHLDSSTFHLPPSTFRLQFYPPVIRGTM